MKTIPAGAESGVAVASFQMGSTEVTREQYEALMGYYSFGAGDDYPAGLVSWFDALIYCNRLSFAAGLDPVYSIAPSSYSGLSVVSATVGADFSKNGYRLPLHSERIRAARGGGSGDYGWGDDSSDATMSQYAWYYYNTGGGTTFEVVGQKLPNGYGLYDMAGNVWEWGWGADVPESGMPKRYGGGNGGGAVDLRSVNFNSMTGSEGVSGNYYDNGFRVVRGSPNQGRTFLFIADGVTNNILSFLVDRAGGAPSQTSSLSPGFEPRVMALSADLRHLYVSDRNLALIHWYPIDPTSGALGSGSSLAVFDSPTDLVVSPDGKYLYAAEGTADIYRYPINADGSLGTGASYDASGGGTYSSVGSLCFSPSGKWLYAGVNGASNGAISQFDVAADGSLSLHAGSPLAQTLSISGIAVRPDGASLYAAENSALPSTFHFALDLATGVPAFADSASNTIWAGGPCMDPQGNFLYVFRSYPSACCWVNSISAGPLASPADISASVQDYGAILFEPSGRFGYVAPVDDRTGSGRGFGWYSKDPATGALTLLGTDPTVWGKYMAIGTLY